MYHLTGISLTPSATALDSLTEVARAASSSESAGMTPTKVYGLSKIGYPGWPQFLLHFLSQYRGIHRRHSQYEILLTLILAYDSV